MAAIHEYIAAYEPGQQIGRSGRRMPLHFPRPPRCRAFRDKGIGRVGGDSGRIRHQGSSEPRQSVWREPVIRIQKQQRIGRPRPR